MAKRHRKGVRAVTKAIHRDAVIAVRTGSRAIGDRIVGPLLDPVDIQIEVPAVPIDELQRRDAGESPNDFSMRVGLHVTE